jgi:hypothetical protein
MDFIHRPVSQDKKTKNLNRSINITSTHKSHKDQITNHRATNLDTHIHKHLKPENTGGKKLCMCVSRFVALWFVIRSLCDLYVDILLIGLFRSF